MSSLSLGARAYALGLPKGTVTPILKEIDGWYRHNGSEWTVSRLKSLKISFIRRIGGLPPNPDSSIEYHSDGTPKGAFRPLFRMIDRDREMSVRAFNLLMAYTSFTSVRVTPRQAKKFLSAVLRNPVDTDALYQATGIVRSGCEGIHVSRTTITRIQYTPRPYKAIQPRKKKRAPVPVSNTDGEVVGFTSLPETQAASAGDRWVLGHTNLVRQYWFWFRSVLDTQTTEQHYAIWHKAQERTSLPFMGKIGLIQEPGFKLRAVANPVRVVQAVLQPIGVALFETLRSVREDCCFDQTAGVEAVAGVLRKGLTVHSVDLSNATDNFPLELQLRALEQMGLPPDAQELLSTFCRGSWAATDLGYDRLSWTVGQPLGLFPSFAMFSLAHHALIRGICRTLGVATHCYVLLGDDVCIWDDRVASAYKQQMEALGCPISHDKTIVSNKVAEFAGMVIAPSAIYHSPKWRKLTPENKLSYLRFHSDHLHGQLKGRTGKLLEFFGPLLSPIGFESNVGAPLEERVSYTLHALEVQAKLRSLDVRSASLSQRLHSAFYKDKVSTPESGFDVNYIEFLEQSEYHSLLSSVGASSLPTYLVELIGGAIASDLVLTLGQERAFQMLGASLWDMTLDDESSFDALQRLIEIRRIVIDTYGTPSWVRA